MAYDLTARAPGKSAMRPKNRAWGFSRNGCNMPLENRPGCPEARRKPRPTPTIFTPGIPQWPSRDPIGETGGDNLYAFVGNCPLSSIDPIGTIIYLPTGAAAAVPSNQQRFVVPSDEAFVNQVKDALQDGVSSKRKGIECLKLSVVKRLWQDGRVRGYWIVQEFGKDWDKDICKNCPNVHKLYELLKSDKVIEVYKADFGGTNAKLADGMDPGGNRRSALLDPSANIELPSVNANGTRGPAVALSYRSIVWHEIVGHGYPWYKGEDSKHPKMPWNYYHPTDPSKDPSSTKSDPVIETENEYHDWVNETRRYPKYYSYPSAPQSGAECCPNDE